MGTSSWSFPGWCGLVYEGAQSERTLSRAGLSAYAEAPLHRTVGLDRTFYRPIEASAFRRLGEMVPEGFRFVVKADRRLTTPTPASGREGSARNRTNAGFLDPDWATEYVVGPAVEGLGRTLGPILFQFPPVPAAEVGGAGPFAERLAGFLDALPKGPCYAVEIRTPALLTTHYRDALEASGAAHGFVLHPAMSSLERQATLLAPHLQPVVLVRWMLRSGLGYRAAVRRYEPFDRIVDDDPEAREGVARLVLSALIAERSAFVIVNNKAEGSAPLSLRRLAAHLDSSATPPTHPAP